MTSKFIIDTALKLRREYGNIYNLIRDKGIILKYVDLDSSIRGLSVDNIIFINSSISNFEKEFVIAHEVGHYEKTKHTDLVTICSPSSCLHTKRLTP